MAALEQMDALEHEGVPTYLVPGVTSAFAASATLRTQLTLNKVANHIAFTRPQGKTLRRERCDRGIERLLFHTGLRLGSG